jgi:hypothetical protein
LKSQKSFKCDIADLTVFKTNQISVFVLFLIQKSAFFHYSTPHRVIRVVGGFSEIETQVESIGFRIKRFCVLTILSCCAVRVLLELTFMYHCRFDFESAFLPSVFLSPTSNFFLGSARALCLRVHDKKKLISFLSSSALRAVRPTLPSHWWHEP